MNLVYLKGNLGFDFSVFKNTSKKTHEEYKLWSNRLAVSKLLKSPNQKFIQGDEWGTDWFNIRGYDSTYKQIESQEIGKGDKVIIVGRLMNHTYTDKMGKLQYVTSVQVNEITKCYRPNIEKQDMEQIRDDILHDVSDNYKLVKEKQGISIDDEDVLWE